MNITPVTGSRYNQTSFGMRKFKVDAKTRQLYYDLCKERGYTGEDLLVELTGLDKTLANLNIKIRKDAEDVLYDNPATKTLLLDKVWPEDTYSTISIDINKGKERDTMSALVDGKYKVCPKTIMADLLKMNPRYSHFDINEFILSLTENANMLGALITEPIKRKALYRQADMSYARRAALSETAAEKLIDREVYKWFKTK